MVASYCRCVMTKHLTLQFWRNKFVFTNSHLQFYSKKISIIIVAAWLCWGGAFSSFAATAKILVGSAGLVFTPASTNIAVNDTVIWTWGGPIQPHSTTSGMVVGTNSFPDGLWNSGVAAGAHSFTNTFASAGNFPYFCQVHFTNGMVGTIIVSGPSLPPNIAITNPVNGAVFSAPANVTIQATATDSNSGGSVTNVQFLVGSSVLANKTTAPFFAVTNNLAAGSYTLSAIASDNVGLKATNSVAISVVTPLPLVIGAPQVPAGGFQFSYPANVGLSYIVQQSTNLAASGWITFFTNTAASNPVVFVDNHATNNPGFYRVGLLPNP